MGFNSAFKGSISEDKNRVSSANIRDCYSEFKKSIIPIWLAGLLLAVHCQLLTFKNRASYIYIGRAYRYPPDVAFYIYFFFNKYKY